MKHTAEMLLLLVAFATTHTFAQAATPADFEAWCKAHKGRWIGDVAWIAD